MARHRRIIEAGQLIHSISRFVNGEFRIQTHAERSEYLQRLGGALRRSDWHLIAYAVMSSHIHLLLIAGGMTFSRFIKGLNAGFSSWINRRQGRFGPVLADRPKTIIIDPCRAAAVIAYLHNNPVRAGVVEAAGESSWSSHGAYLGKAPCPEWLDAEIGLRIAGYSSDADALVAFDAFVREHERAGRDLDLSGGNTREEQKKLRRQYRTAVEVAHPELTTSGLFYPAHFPTKPWSGELDVAIACAAEWVGLSAFELCGPNRSRTVVRARKIVVSALRTLGRSQREIGQALGISGEAVGRLERSAGRVLEQDAIRLAMSLRNSDAEE